MSSFLSSLVSIRGCKVVPHGTLLSCCHYGASRVSGHWHVLVLLASVMGAAAAAAAAALKQGCMQKPSSLLPRSSGEGASVAGAVHQGHGSRAFIPGLQSRCRGVVQRSGSLPLQVVHLRGI
eukprot:865058-Pelagomonas_calceolata.AAC.5